MSRVIKDGANLHAVKWSRNDAFRTGALDKCTGAPKVIAPKYWFDHKTSNGWWRGDDIIVKDWDYIDVEGKE